MKYNIHLHIETTSPAGICNTTIVPIKVEKGGFLLATLKTEFTSTKAMGTIIQDKPSPAVAHNLSYSLHFKLVQIEGFFQCKICLHKVEYISC